MYEHLRTGEGYICLIGCGLFLFPGVSLVKDFHNNFLGYTVFVVSRYQLLEDTNHLVLLKDLCHKVQR